MPRQALAVTMRWRLLKAPCEVSIPKGIPAPGAHSTLAALPVACFPQWISAYRRRCARP